jgi:hypothetical protein
MFESKPSHPHYAMSGSPGHFSDEDLTAFSWSDLIARLCATQELRLALARLPAAARASFDSMAAEHLAKRRAFVLHEGKPRVNLAPSVNGKGAGAKGGPGAAPAQSAHRGIA